VPLPAFTNDPSAPIGADDHADATCQKRADGTCREAGTEWCDWQCPYNIAGRADLRRSLGFRKAPTRRRRTRRG
jgi:hypothetical protein